MSKMLAEIKRIVNEDISNRVTQYDVLFEAITNAIHSNSSIINCYLSSNDNPIQENGTDIVSKKVDSVKIVDNGEGFTQENYNSFCKYRTEHKKILGGKGVGRFVFLKVFNNVTFESHIATDNKRLNFRFDFDFDTENLQQCTEEVLENYTEISLSNLTQQYYNPSRNIDRRIELNLEKIRLRVLLHLIPILFFYKKKDTNVIINFIDATTGEMASINKEDIPDFLQHDFTLKDKNETSYKFTLNYIITSSSGYLNAFYCANNRTVCDFSEKDFKITLPNGFSGFLLLEGEYLDTHVNNERTGFDIFPVRTDIFSMLSWEIINDGLRNEIANIVNIHIPEAKSLNQEKIKVIQEKRPYLINYIEESDIDMAGFIDEKQIIDKAKKRFDVAKENVLSNSGQKDFTNQELQDAIQLTHNELVSYINDRVIVLEKLKTLVDKKEKVESVIHNLFMERHTDDDYFSIGKNNLWLLDDRFTTYSYAASDKKISEVLSAIGEYYDDALNPNDKPDLSLFFSQNPNSGQKLKSVLIEIKPFDYSTKSDRKKFFGIQQLLDYVKAFKTRENIEEIYGFLVTDIDHDLSERLIGDGYTGLFSQQNPIFHRFYEKLGISIYVVSAKTLIADAEARNKIFLDIIRKQNKIYSLLNENLGN